MSSVSVLGTEECGATVDYVESGTGGARGGDAATLKVVDGVGG